MLLLLYYFQVLEQHLVCAALEHPLSLLYDEKYFGPGLCSTIVSLKNKGCLSYDPSCDSSAAMWSYIGKEVCCLFAFRPETSRSFLFNIFGSSLILCDVNLFLNIFLYLLRFWLKVFSMFFSHHPKHQK